MQSERFTGIGKLIKELKDAGVIKETDEQLNVLFDDWGESKLLFKGNYLWKYKKVWHLKNSMI